jgi:hypothetical protein
MKGYHSTRAQSPELGPAPVSGNMARNHAGPTRRPSCRFFISCSSSEVMGSELFRPSTRTSASSFTQKESRPIEARSHTYVETGSNTPLTFQLDDERHISLRWHQGPPATHLASRDATAQHDPLILLNRLGLRQLGDRAGTRAQCLGITQENVRAWLSVIQVSGPGMHPYLGAEHTTRGCVCLMSNANKPGTET